MKKAMFVLVLIVMIPALTAALDFEFGGVRIYTVFGFLPVPTGGDARIVFGGGGITPFLPGSIAVAFGGGYEAEDVFRNADGTPIDQPYTDDEVGIERLELYLEPAFNQRLSASIPLSLYAGVRTRFRQNFAYENAAFAGSTYFPDRSGVLVNALRIGLRLESVDTERSHRDRKGVDAGAMVEWAPPFLGNRIYGEPDFLRLNLAGRFYVPLYDAAPDRDRNLFNISFADQILLDWLTGKTVPIHAQAEVGGFAPDDGLGGIVRGFEARSKPSLLKIVNNAEVRLIGPAIGLPSLLPVLTAFVDAGVYSGFVSEGFSFPSGPSGLIASAGATVGLHVLDITQFGFTVAVPLAGSRADERPVGMEIAIGLHF